MSLKSRDFVLKGTNKQFEWVFGKYEEALKAKAEAKDSKPENLLKIDKWFHTDLPKKLKSRGKEAHLTHEEIVSCMKWKLAMGKYQKKLKDLIQMNTPRVVMTETKKAFRNLDKRNDLEAAILALSNLKGVGPAFASCVLAAYRPDKVPFMSEEVLLSMPDCDEVDFTMKEYNKMVDELTSCQARLAGQGGEWGLHRLDTAVFSYYVLREHKPDLLKEMPGEEETGGVDTAQEVTAAAENDNESQENGGKENQENGDKENQENGDKENQENGCHQNTENGAERTNGEVEKEPEPEKTNGTVSPRTKETVSPRTKDTVSPGGGGAKRPLETEDDYSNSGSNGTKRPREDEEEGGDKVENGENSPHKPANLSGSGQLVVC